MGLTSWKHSPNGRILKSDVSIAKNYLTNKELEFLQDIVNMYLDIAENRAKRQIPMKMKDWVEELNTMLKTNRYEVLDNKGTISAEQAKEFAEKEYEKFRKVYQKRDKVKMYLAHGYKKRHCYDSETMETQEYKMGEHDGVLLIYELPDTVKEKKTEAEAYAAVWDIMMELQKELPNSVVYYGQDFLQEEGKRFDEMGVFLPLEHFSDRLERHIEKADQIVYGK